MSDRTPVEVVRAPRPGIRERLVDLLIDLLEERRRDKSQHEAVPPHDE